MTQEKIPLEEWKKLKQQECKEILEKQKTEIRKVLTDGEGLADFFYQKGRLGLDMTMGNAALVLAEFPKAEKVKSLSDWKQLHRWVMKGEKGIPIVVPRKKYWAVEHVFEASQTHGQKLPTAKEKNFCRNAVERLIQLSPVPVMVNGTSENKPVLFDADKKMICMDISMKTEKAICLLPKVLLEAQVDEMEKGAAQKPLTQFYAEAVSILLAGSLGLPMDVESKKRLAALANQVDVEQGQAVLEEINRYASVYEERILPSPKQEKQKAQPAVQRSEP